MISQFEVCGAAIITACWMPGGIREASFQPLMANIARAVIFQKPKAKEGKVVSWKVGRLVGWCFLTFNTWFARLSEITFERVHIAYPDRAKVVPLISAQTR